jgi:hypothetical protein
MAIGFQGLFSKDFRQAAGADPAVEFHLPQTVLCHSIAHGEKKIRFAMCVNMRYAVYVAKDFHRVPDAATVMAPDTCGWLNETVRWNQKRVTAAARTAIPIRPSRPNPNHLIHRFGMKPLV